MFPLFRQHLRLWILWTLVVSGLLFVKPWGTFGWVEMVAALGPLCMAIDRRVKREAILAFGLPAITLIWLLDRGVSSLDQMLLGWVVFGIGALLGSRAIASQRDLEQIAGNVAFAPPDRQAYEDLRDALQIELARARRHDRSFVVLSIAVHPDSVEVAPLFQANTDLTRALAENRARVELQELLMKELHSYAHVAPARGRVLALVPEIEGEVAVAALVQRLEAVASEELSYGIQVGVASFPRDAVSADELIDTADQSRHTSKIRAFPDRIGEQDMRESAEIVREVQN